MRNTRLLYAFSFSSILLVSGLRREPDDDGFYRIHNSDYSQDYQLAFTVLGDWGGREHPPYVSEVQESALRLLTGVTKRDNVKFNLAIGDNFYDHGIKSIYDHRWYHTYENCYSDASLQIPWYSVLGNHDWRGNASAQVDYTNYDWRWNLPDFYYSVTYEFGDSKKLTMIMIDTAIHCDCTDDWVEIGYPTLPTKEMREKQLEWLKAELEATKDHDYVLLVGHYPVYTEKGIINCMLDINELAHQYKVTAYIYGHQHYIAHLVDKDPTYPLDHLCSGYGAKSQGSWDEPDTEDLGYADVKFMKIKIAGFNGGIMKVTAAADKLTADFYFEGYHNGALDPMHSISIEPRK